MRRREIDLDAMAAKLALRYYGAELDVEICWGDPTRAMHGLDAWACVEMRPRGRYQIIIDRSLKERAPLYVIRDCVWHELAHVIRHEQCGDLDADHSPAYAEIERLSPDLERAAKWLENNPRDIDDIEL